MKKWLIFLGWLLSLAVAVTAVALEKSIELNISAASSLKDVLTGIQINYLRKEPNLKINFNFCSSGALQTQIEQGVPCDLFISAAVQQVDALEKEGLLQKGTRKNILMNQLVLIVPQDSKMNIKNFKDLNSDRVQKIGIGAPESVPAGRYAVEVFKYFGIWGKIQSKLVLGTNVRAVLTYVETGNVDAGVVYKTDALISDKVKVVAGAAPESHGPIIYPAAILAKAGQSKAAMRFLGYLTSAAGKAVFEKYGFIVLK